ncbi:MAG TPA: ABC transporter ATP-binding protein [Bacillota bacterium]|nr:ABC transporter ATP-binding protein [Bacillota bacterium]
MLKVEGLSVRYGQVTVVRDVSFNVSQGEIVTLVGANGAGKSSIINGITGVIPCVSGKVEFLGTRIDSMKPNERVELGLVQIPEGRCLFGNMTVMENLELGAYIRRARPKRQETMDYVFSLFPILKERKEQIAKTLSGGEQQMLSIARGLMCKPRMLILDEPSWGLAPKLVSEVISTIKAINSEGMTILLVEQHVKQCLEISNRAYVVENGRIVLQGLGREVFENSMVKKAYLGL